MCECSECGRVLDHDYQDIGVCQYCLDNGDSSEEDFPDIVRDNIEDNEDY